MIIKPMGIPQTCIYPFLHHWTLTLAKKAGNIKFCLAGNGSVQASWLCACISQAHTWAACEPLLSVHTQDAALMALFARGATTSVRCLVQEMCTNTEALGPMMKSEDVPNG